ncbi:MAG: GFA family protein [Pseudomonadota bacterium]
MMTGGCQCGAVRYELTGPPRDAYACHCNECRKQSASAFGISVLVDRTHLRILQGETQVWSRPTDSGGTLFCHFCPDCGTRLWHIGSNDPETVSVKGGSLDTPPDFDSLHHIWVGQKLSGLSLPSDATCHDKEPP